MNEEKILSNLVESLLKYIISISKDIAIASLLSASISALNNNEIDEESILYEALLLPVPIKDIKIDNNKILIEVDKN